MSSRLNYRVICCEAGTVVAAPSGLRLLPGEMRPYTHSPNLRVDRGGRVVYITGRGVESTALPVATQPQQDEYAWAAMGARVDKCMPFSNGVVFGVVHDLVPWVQPDAAVLAGALSTLDFWLLYGDSFLRQMGLGDIFSDPLDGASAGGAGVHGAGVHVNEDTSLECYETIVPACARRIRF